jgi:hypothetical protein
MPSQIAPIALFAYKRPDELRRTLTDLQANYLAPETELYVFVDGPKNPPDLPKVEAVRAIIDSVTGFKAVHRYYADKNCGLASSIIAGVSRVMSVHGQAIVLEDDLLTSRNFLDYMNQCLREYKANKRVFSVSAYSFPFKKPDTYQYDGYMIQRPNSWGWATWADRWEKADWLVSDYKVFEKDDVAKKGFKQGGADLIGMLHKQQNKIIDSWYIRWCYSQYKSNGLTIYPVMSKIQNIGFNEEATNTNIFNRYRTQVDEGLTRKFCLPVDAQSTPYYHRLNLNEYSLGVRLYNRIKTYSIRFRDVLTARKVA